MAAVAIESAPVAMGLAIVENSYEQPYRIVGTPPERIHETDRELLVEAKARGLEFRIEQCPMPGWTTGDSIHNNITLNH